MLWKNPLQSRPEGSFLKTVLVKSAPNALVMFIPVLIIMLFGAFGSSIAAATRNSVAMIVVTVVGYINLVFICRPFTKWRLGVALLIAGGLIAIVPASIYLGYILPVLPVDVLGFLPAFENLTFLFAMLGIGVALAFLLQIFRSNMERGIFSLVDRIEKRKSKN